MKPTYNEYMRHRKDNLLHRGFEYDNKVLQNSLAGALYLEDKRRSILNKLEEPITQIINSIKYIKKSYNWALDLHFTKFN